MRMTAAVLSSTLITCKILSKVEGYAKWLSLSTLGYIAPVVYYRFGYLKDCNMYLRGRKHSRSALKRERSINTGFRTISRLKFIWRRWQFITRFLANGDLGKYHFLMS